MGIGGTPGSEPYKTQYDNIRQCVAHHRCQNINLYLGSGGNAGDGGGNRDISGCTCRWHNRSHPWLPQATTASTPAATARAPTNDAARALANDVARAPAQDSGKGPMEVPFLFPSKPEAKTRLHEVLNKTQVYPGKNTKHVAEFDLVVFAPTEGKCPHCGGIPKLGCRLNTSLKIVHTICKSGYFF